MRIIKANRAAPPGLAGTVRQRGSRTGVGLLAALLCALSIAPPAAAQTAPRRPAVPQTDPAEPAEPPAQSYEGGAGGLPGAQFQRKLEGGPGFVCTATNALHDQQCTASCRAGETADCVDAEGGGAPSCGCTKG